jgi:two-component system, OmpR family, phosphate regulon response regulator PhoB
VLVVEDDGPTREMYRFALIQNGYSVTAVDDGLAALRVIEAGAPDIIVLDMALPRLGGRDVLRELRANPATRTLPIIIVTGTDVTHLNERALTPVLQKPIDPEALVREVDDVLRRSISAGRA